jgi:hexosaminidase
MKISAARILTFAFLASGWSFVRPILGQLNHARLLPEPRQIQYADGWVNVRQLCAAPIPHAVTEDEFVLKTLKDGLHASLPSCVEGKIAVRLERTGSVDALPVPNETPGPESREAYQLNIGRDGVVIRARSSAGVYYGAQTLLQMVERDANGNARLPYVTVHDWPELAYRGTLVDAGSEGPMLTFEEVERQIDFLAKWKDNQYFFYSEGNIEMRGYPLLNPNARFTQQQIREIVAYARQRHVDVVPAVEMYGHLHDLFRIEKYSDLADFPHGGEFNPNSEKTRAVLQDWSNQLAELFPSKFVDIGFDETWSLQKNAEHAGANSTPVQLFIQQLTFVTNLFHAKGKTVMAYADIMVKFPGIVQRLPKGLIALPWWYDPIDDAAYKQWLQPLAAEGVPHIVTTGVTSWDQIAPDFTLSFENIDTFLAAGQRSHSIGLLNTLWTDSGQNFLRLAWPGMAYGAAAAWQHAPMQRNTFFVDYSRIQYSPKTAEHFSSALEDLDIADRSLQHAIGNGTILQMWRDPFTKSSLDSMKGKTEDLRQARLKAEDALEHFYAIKKMDPDTPQIDSFVVAAQMIDLAGMKFQYANEIAETWASIPAHATREQLMDALFQGVSNDTHSRCMDIMDGLTELRGSYREAWVQQYTPYRLGTALGRWDAEDLFWEHARANFERVRTRFKTGDTLPTLQEVTSPGYVDER